MVSNASRCGEIGTLQQRRSIGLDNDLCTYTYIHEFERGCHSWSMFVITRHQALYNYGTATA